MIYILLLLAAVVAYYAIKSNPITPRSNWHHNFNDLKFSSQEFYQKVQEAVKKREIPNVSFKEVSLSQGGVFSANRAYLRITRDEYIFDICAAPFGTDFFVSWWLGESVRDVVGKIPILNTLAGKNPKMKTYYQADTEAMFRGAVHSGVLEAIDQMTTAKGIRGLSEMDRQYRIVSS